VEIIAEAVGKGASLQGVDPLIDRAITAHWRDRDGRTGTGFNPPDRAQVAEHDGKRYVVLWDGNLRLRCYRVRAYDGILRLMKRPPREIGQLAPRPS
jgi:hypothetical protein